MPTLAARNSPATTARATATATTMAMTTISTNLDATTATSTLPPTTTATNSNPATCTFSAANNDYHHPQQQQQQQQQHHQLNNHHYHHPPPPPHPVASAASSYYDVLPTAAPAAATITTTAPNAITSTATSLATFNGNSNTANGNIGSSNGNGNANSHSSNVIGSTCSKSETSSTAGSIIGGGGGGGISVGISGSSSIMKKTSAVHASREDVASLGGASSVNSQMSATNNNNNNHNITGNTNNNNIMKSSKENLLQNYYNGGGGGVEGANRNAEIDDPGDGLGALPQKWETAYTERGELYFIDHNTGTSHWLDPRLSKYQKKSLEDCGDNELPYGWEKIEDSLYGTYYIDHVNRRTQYENPVLEAKRRAAEHTQNLQQQQQRSQTPSAQILLNGGLNVGRLGINSSIPPPSNVDISQRGMQPPPPVHSAFQKPPLLPYKFTRNPSEMQGERITTTLLKSARGLGITIVGGDDGAEEFLQIKSIVPNGPAWLDGQLQTGDILVYVNDTCVLGFTHHEMVNVFQSILPGENVTLEVCRGYPLPFDPNDPNNEVVTTIAVDGISSVPDKQRRMLIDMNMDGNYNFLDVSGENMAHGGAGGLDATSSGGFILMKKPEVQTFSIVKGSMGFGFTIADSSYGQKVKKILDRNCCTHLQEGDILLEINDVRVHNKSHLEVVQVLKDCSKTEPTSVKIQRGGAPSSSPSNFSTNVAGNVSKLRKNFIGNTGSGLFRSKTPTADLYSTQQKEILPIRPKTPLVDTRRARVKTPNNELNDAEVAAASTNGGGHQERTLAESKSQVDGHKSTNSLQEIDAINQEIPFMDPYPKLVTSLSERLAEATLMGDNMAGGAAGVTGGGVSHSSLGYHSSVRPNYENQEYVSASNHSGSYNPIYGLSPMPPTMSPLNPVSGVQPLTTIAQLYPQPTTPLSLLTPPTYTYHHESCYCYECQDYRGNKYRQHQQQQQQQQPINYYGHHQLPASSVPLNSHHHQTQYSPHSAAATPLQAAHIQNERMQKRVNELLSDRRRVGFPPLDHAHNTLTPHPQPQIQQQQHSPSVNSTSQQANVSWNAGVGYNVSNAGLRPNMLNGLDSDGLDADHFELSEVTLERQALGFGFRIVGGTEEGSQVTVGHIVPGGAADHDHRITTGDEILSIDGISVVNSSHHKVVSLMGEAALRGQVTMILRRRTRSSQQMPLPLQHQLPRSTGLRYPYDVIVSRHENEGFGFVIISSSNQYYGSTIGKLIPGSPADRCGELKVGDRIVAVNRIDIAGMSHGDVVNLIKESGLHVRLTIGCPKEGSGLGSAGSGGANTTLLINSAQASPSQLSQTQLSQPPLPPLLMPPQHQPNDTSTYFERPSVGAAGQQQPQQQQPQLQQQPPQL